MKVIIVNSFDTFEYRVMLMRQVLWEMGQEVLVIGSDFRHIEKDRRSSQDAGLVLLPAMAYNKNLSLRRMLSHHQFAGDAYEYIKDMECDLLYLVVPPNSQTTIAKRYCKKHPKTKVIMDLIDLWPESFPSKYTDFFPFTLWGRVRNQNLKYADCILTECDLYQNKLQAYLREKWVETVYWARGTEHSALSVSPAVTEPSREKWVLGYLGSVNHIVDLEKIGKVLSFFQKDRPVELHVVGGGEKLEELLQCCKKHGAEVKYHGKIYEYDKKKEIFDRCHFGLNIMKDTVVVGLSMKSIDYMEMGVPIINSLQGDSRDFVEKEKMGYNIEHMETRYCQEFRTNARRFYEKNCSYEAFRTKVREIFQKLL